MQFTKSSLAVALSRLEVFPSPKPKLEQYPTDSEIAADMLWAAFMNREIKGKIIADLGCGTGILGIGALLLGAKKVFFVDKDNDAIGILKANLRKAGLNRGFSIENIDISQFDREADIVIQNPPFGTREKHIDRLFLAKAMETAGIIYSFHKTSTRKFVEAFAKDNGFRITAHWEFSFPLKQTLAQHRKRIQRIEVTCFRLEKS